MRIVLNDRNELLTDLYELAKYTELINGLRITYIHTPEISETIKIDGTIFSVEVNIYERSAKLDYKIYLKIKHLVPIVEANQIMKFTNDIEFYLKSNDYFMLEQ